MSLKTKGTPHMSEDKNKCSYEFCWNVNSLNSVHCGPLQNLYKAVISMIIAAKSPNTTLPFVMQTFAARNVLLHFNDPVALLKWRFSFKLRFKVHYYVRNWVIASVSTSLGNDFLCRPTLREPPIRKLESFMTKAGVQQNVC